MMEIEVCQTRGAFLKDRYASWDIPRRLLILLLNVRSGRSMVFATARTINLLCRKPGQLKKLYMTD
jgi:hypothetical protein